MRATEVPDWTDSFGWARLHSTWYQSDISQKWSMSLLEKLVYGVKSGNKLLVVQWYIGNIYLASKTGERKDTMLKWNDVFLQKLFCCNLFLIVIMILCKFTFLFLMVWKWMSQTLSTVSSLKEKIYRQRLAFVTYLQRCG